MGLIKTKKDYEEPDSKVGVPIEKDQLPLPHETALSAAQQSLVLLENKDSTLPIDLSSYKYIVLAGERTVTERSSDGKVVPTVMQDFDNIGA